MCSGRWQRSVLVSIAAGMSLGLILLSQVAAARVLAQEPRQPEAVYIPLAPSGGVATPAPTPVTGARVYGLLGRLELSRGRRYDHYLVTADNATYALAGETPAIEQQISTLAGGAPPVLIKVWGVVQSPQMAGDAPLIVVSGVLSTTTPPTVGGASTPVAVVKFARVNLYAEPRESASITGGVVLRQACDIVGRNPARTWWLLDCADGQEGWIDARLVDLQGSTANVPVVVVLTPTPLPPTPTPRVTPTPLPATTARGWQMEIFANQYLAGQPVATVDVPAITFNWRDGSPSPSVPVDSFSLRFTRRINFSPGYYRFTAQADDGVRLWLNDQLLVDEWHGASNQVYSAGRVLVGEYSLRVEYYEASGLANLRVTYEVGSDVPEWDAGYFRGTGLTGAPVLRQQEPRMQTPLDYTWAYSSPLPDQLGIDFWSARWVGEFQFDDGNYTFRANADDGVRVWLDGLPVIDQWRDGYKEVSNRFIGVGAGRHTVKVEYYERTGLASLRVWWVRDSSYSGPR
jgi:hypothetical protein